MIWPEQLRQFFTRKECFWQSIFEKRLVYPQFKTSSCSCTTPMKAQLKIRVTWQEKKNEKKVLVRKIKRYDVAQRGILYQGNHHVKKRDMIITFKKKRRGHAKSENYFKFFSTFCNWYFISQTHLTTKWQTKFFGQTSWNYIHCQIACQEIPHAYMYLVRK